MPIDIHSDAGSQIPDRFVHPIDAIEPIPEETYTKDEVRLAVGSMLHELGATSNAALTLDCYKALFGLNIYERRSYADIARAYGISRQAVNKRCKEIADKIGVVGGVFSKKSMSRNTYRLTNSPRVKVLG